MFKSPADIAPGVLLATFGLATGAGTGAGAATSFGAAACCGAKDHETLNN
jgi:hypothetical protein